MKHKDAYDAIDLDPQLAIYDLIASLPGVGSKVADYVRSINDAARELGLETMKPVIAGSNAHRFEDIGLSYITVPESRLYLESGPDLVRSLKTAIRKRSFSTHFEYEPLFDLLSWTGQFKKGLARKSDE